MAAQQRSPETCFFHDRVEDVTDSTYRVCGECHHVFPTRKDFVNAFRSEFPGPPVPVHFGVCPLCAHDL